MKDGVPMGALDVFWVKQFSSKFDVFQNTSLNGRFCDSEVHSSLLSGPSFTYSLDGNDAIVLYLLYAFGTSLGSCLRILLVSYSIYGVNHVSLRSIIYGAPLYDLCYTIYVQFFIIVPSLINGAVENLSSNTTWNWGETWPVSGFRTRDTYPAWNGEWPRYIPDREQG